MSQSESTDRIEQLARRIEELEVGRSEAKLEDMQEGLARIKSTVDAIETRRDAWLRTLVLAIAAPIAAGVFGVIDKQREIEVKKFEQYNLLVDRALDATKGETYRLGVLYYIRDLDTGESTKHMGAWADRQIANLETQRDAIKNSELPAAEELLEAKKAEAEAAQQKVADLQGQLAVAQVDTTYAAEQVVISTQAELDTAVREEAVALVKVEDVVQQVNELQQRLGTPPTAIPMSPLAPGNLTSSTSFSSGWILVVTSDVLLGSDVREGTRYDLSRIIKVDPSARIVKRKQYYHVVVGPYQTKDTAQIARGRLVDTDLRPEESPRLVTQFCPDSTELGTGVTLCSG